MRTVYKVLDVYSEEGKLLSSGTSGEHELEYKVGEVNRHKNMFVFDTLEHAQHYGPTDAIWEARTSNVKPAPERIIFGSIDRFFDDFWNAWERGEYDWFKGYAQPHTYGGKWYDHLFRAPAGTLLCDDLLLIQEVKE